jgi:hypothetical protein
MTGEKFILQNGDDYSEAAGEIYVRIVKVILKDQVYIVARMHLEDAVSKIRREAGDSELRWYYNTYYTGAMSYDCGRYGGNRRKMKFVTNHPTRHDLTEEDGL